mgnify:CR=1 FL=1
MGKRQGRRPPAEPVDVLIEGLSHEGRGIAHNDGRVLFIQGALPGETVSAKIHKRRRQQDEGQATHVEQPAADRVEPPCSYAGVCGGCSLQHMSVEAQLKHKADSLSELLTRVGRITPQRWLPPLSGPTTGYRRRARLGAKFVPRKGDRVLVGFRERFSPFIADIDHCEVLDRRVGERLSDLSELIRSLDIPDRIAQIEVAAGDDAVGLVLRNLRPLSDADRAKLVAFGELHGFRVFEQPGNEQTVAPIGHTATRLHYALPEFDLRFAFAPTDFTQINASINRQMVHQAVELLALEPTHRVLDLFCGLGNFTLPIARQAGTVIGIEGAESLVERGRENAQLNGIHNVEFLAADLTRVDAGGIPSLNGIDRVLLDPPRSGAIEVLPTIAALGAERIVYVSCGPATFARDAGELVHTHGYELEAVGVMDMFPHTSHAETMGVFVRSV